MVIMNNKHTHTESKMYTFHKPMTYWFDYLAGIQMDPLNKQMHKLHTSYSPISQLRELYSRLPTTTTGIVVTNDKRR